MTHQNPLLLIAALLLGACASSSSRNTVVSGEEVDSLVRHGKFEEAVHAAKRLADENPDDELAAEVHRAASVAYLIHQGRTASFEGLDVDALRAFANALAIDPESEHALAWHDKTSIKLADKWFNRARDLHTDENLEGAVIAYENSLGYVPDHQEALKGIARATIQLNYRDGLSDRYYNEGVRSLADWELQIAKSRFGYSGEYDRHSSDKPERRIREVNRELAISRVALAGNLEADLKFAAARNEYRLAMSLDASNEAARDGYERLVFEAEADRLRREGNMFVLRGEFEKGRGLLEEALALTNEQEEVIQADLDKIDDARIKRLYELGLDYEHDYRYELAIEIFNQILEARGFYEDTVTRVGTLEGYIENAARLYERAGSAESEEERVNLLRQIAVFWPEYRDIRERINAFDGVRDQ